MLFRSPETVREVADAVVSDDCPITPRVPPTVWLLVTVDVPTVRELITP